MSNTPEQNNAKRTVPGVFVWDMVRKALRAAEEGVFCWMFENDEICLNCLGFRFPPSRQKRERSSRVLAATSGACVISVTSAILSTPSERNSLI